MSIVIFYIIKETDEFKSYQIIENKTQEEIETALQSYNSNDKHPTSAKIITDKHTISAIISHKSIESIESVVDDFKNISSDIEDNVNDLIRIIENMHDDLKALKTKKVVGLVKQWCDINLFATYEVATYKESKKAKAKGIGGQNRIVHTNYSAAWDAKNRCGLPDTMPLDMATIIEAIENGKPDTPENIYEDAKELAEKYLKDKVKTDTLAFLEKNKTNLQALSVALNKLRNIANEAEKQTDTSDHEKKAA